MSPFWTLIYCFKYRKSKKRENENGSVWSELAIKLHMETRAPSCFFQTELHELYCSAHLCRKLGKSSRQNTSLTAREKTQRTSQHAVLKILDGSIPSPFSLLKSTFAVHFMASNLGKVGVYDADTNYTPTSTLLSNVETYFYVVQHLV